MAKKKNQRKKPWHKRATSPTLPPDMSWMDKEGLHAILPGVAPTAERLAVLNDNFRKELRNSPLWDEMIGKFGIEEAEKLLKEIKVELRG
jgi:hypothetical protein